MTSETQSVGAGTWLGPISCVSARLGILNCDLQLSSRPSRSTSISVVSSFPNFAWQNALAVSEKLRTGGDFERGPESSGEEREGLNRQRLRRLSYGVNRSKMWRFCWEFTLQLVRIVGIGRGDAVDHLSVRNFFRFSHRQPLNSPQFPRCHPPKTCWFPFCLVEAWFWPPCSSPDTPPLREG